VSEAIERFDCFGSRCAVLVMGESPASAARLVRRRLLRWHERFSRFEPDSELSRLNADARARVKVTSTMALLAEAAVRAAVETDGLVDSSLVTELESAGYTGDLNGSVPIRDVTHERRAATPARRQWWRKVSLEGNVLIRPPGLRLDSGGLGKGLFADLAADMLRETESFAVDCGGDLRLGGRAGMARRVDVASPFEAGTLHSFDLSEGGVATSGIGRRSWLGPDGAPAHHILDPGTGRPAFTGIVQATALAPTALAAETLAKAALLSGPESARRWLPHGGLLVFDDGSHEVMPPC
jgi:FAD:protein FMN transferase